MTTLLALQQQLRIVTPALTICSHNVSCWLRQGLRFSAHGVDAAVFLLQVNDPANPTKKLDDYWGPSQVNCVLFACMSHCTSACQSLA